MNVKEWISQEQGKHFCSCGCGKLIIIKRHHHNKGIPKFINGHNSYNKDIEIWVKQEQGKHFCQCGCGKEIIILSVHYNKGIPKVIKHHLTEEMKEKIKLQKGWKHTEKSKLKMSKWHTGKKLTQKHKNNISKVTKGRTSFWKGKEFSEKHKENLSKARKGRPGNIWTDEMKRNLSKTKWKGGLRASNRRRKSKRKNLNPNPIELNKDFKGSQGHHCNENYIINIPHEIHHGKGCYHNQYTGKGMKEMNQKAFKYLWDHQENILLSIEEVFKINLIVNNKWS